MDNLPDAAAKLWENGLGISKDFCLCVRLGVSASDQSFSTFSSIRY